jgi:DEAD/DEAH box helicase domain-containing protein
VPARTLPLPAGLHPDLAEALHTSGIQTLYIHQAQTWDNVQSGRHTGVVSGTASGKTLCYNLPILDRLAKLPSARALYLFPTKALAQDQHSALQKLCGACPSGSCLNTLEAAIYDGDTPARSRSAIRGRARILLSNPDMLHIGILPHHPTWAEFFRNLHFIVIDEMHIYRGVFGSHVANVIRRLKRIASFYGAAPLFILTSATIANPGELAFRLVEEEVAVVDEDGSARGQKTFLLYNPPVIDQDLGLRRSATQESVRLAEDLLTYHVQTILFSRTRRSVEIILTYLRERAAGAPSDHAPGNPEEHVRGYRSGYLPNQRRQIERGLRDGAIRTVIATNALELGIDIGSLGAALMVGYPGSIASTRQQAGRAGRGEDAALAILVATADPLDQFLAAHSDYLFERSPEHALINPDNLLILLDHLRCAAFELPFREGEQYGRLPQEVLNELLAFLAQQGTLYQAGAKYFWMADQYPAQQTSLRSSSANPIILQSWEAEQASTIGIIDRASALWMVHPEAIYLHEGQTYLVESLDLEHSLARLRSIQTDYYTEPKNETTVQVLEEKEQSAAAGCTKAHGELLVTTQVKGFRKIRWHSHEILGNGEVDLPPSELLTTGYWISIDDATVNLLREQGLWNSDPNDYGPTWRIQRERARKRDGFRCQVCGIPEQDRSHDVHHKIPFRTFASAEQANRLENLITLCPPCHHRTETAVHIRSGLAGVAFALGHLAPFFLMCDSGDLGVHSDPQFSYANDRPAIILYDQAPGGIGFSLRLFEIHQELLKRAYELVTNCLCQNGCPSCVGPGGENGLGGKNESLAILKSLA